MSPRTYKTASTFQFNPLNASSQFIITNPQNSENRFPIEMPFALTNEVILECCASPHFASSLASHAPFATLENVIYSSRYVWWHEVSHSVSTISKTNFQFPRLLNFVYILQTPITGWLEAFAAHPKIGDLDSLRKKFDAFNAHSQGEQVTAAASATDDTLQSLAEWNTKYEAKFGHIFIICAAGRSAAFMLDAIKLGKSLIDFYHDMWRLSF